MPYKKDFDKGKAVVSWTGGKDGCYACYKAMAEGYQITHLLNFRNMNKTGSHEINPAIIRAQSEALGIALLQRDFFSYEQEFKNAVLDLRAKGEQIDAAVFGHGQVRRVPRPPQHHRCHRHRALRESLCRSKSIVGRSGRLQRPAPPTDAQLHHRQRQDHPGCVDLCGVRCLVDVPQQGDVRG